ncbi:ASCH domain-containing protein [Streptomyces sp. NBC_01373]|uniref:ASCH domain-containing protein n=1 Tax=Streptomyces sp. NBC_01373 TaxID=2903843 RepID=UPI0022538AC1|nr:ASCH domain-containing protein [Streptomyces sp. NBC_01373]MCX4707171.1 ASCH domain-containing protein [Streptomyces sp. NBC_01373]
MRALTIRQPWATAITYADKRVENRVWPTSYRGPVLIHAGKQLDRRHGPMVAAVVRGLQLELGAVLAVARITDCHEDDGECTPWSASGNFHLVLDEVTTLPLPISWPGAQQLWTPPTVLVDRVREQLESENAAHVLREEAGPC